MESKVSSVPSPSSSECTVTYFQSDCDDHDEYEEEVTKKKKKMQNKDWLFVKTFQNCKDAEVALKEECTWSIYYTRKTEEGQKRYYRCNKVKLRGPQCSAQVYLLFDSQSDSVFMYRTDAIHDHDKGNSSSYGLSEHVKMEINKLLELNLKPKAIMQGLSKIEGIELPRMSQLRNYLTDHRRPKYNNHILSLGELETWLLSHSNVPEDVHEVFVISYEISDAESAQKFRFILSTKYLLGLAREMEVLHADTTSKLVWQGFPVLVAGTTDKNGKFHALCLSIAASEETDDFKMFFSALKNNVQSLYSNELKPTVLVCDTARSIQNAFTEVFGNEVFIRMCWTLAKKNMQAKADSLFKKNAQEILTDIDALHDITCSEIFDAASQAFLRKYENHKEFVEYFKEQWLTQNRNWYLGAAPALPSTNDALESFIRVIKDSHILRERFPLSRFLVVITEMVSEWSERYAANETATVVSKVPTITLDEWTQAYHWTKLLSKTMIDSRSDENYNYYQVPTGESNDFEKHWESFDEFKKQHFSSCQVVLPLNKENWMEGKCNCPKFYNIFICKHVIGLSIILKYVVPPPEAKNIPIVEKRKRGRPSKAKRALIIQ